MDAKSEVVTPSIQITTPEDVHQGFVAEVAKQTVLAHPKLEPAKAPESLMPIPLSTHMQGAGAEIPGSQQVPTVTTFAEKPLKPNFLQRVMHFLGGKLSGDNKAGKLALAGEDNLPDHVTNMAKFVGSIGQSNNEAATKVVSDPAIPTAIHAQRQEVVGLEKAA